MNGKSYLPRQRRETVQRRRDRFGQMTARDPAAKRLSVYFTKDFERFANVVAHQLRRQIKYRSDSGSVARGLVIDSDPEGSFYRLHWNACNRWNWVEGKWYWIWALLHRRKSRIPSERWVTKIQFDRFWTSKSFENGDVLSPTKTPEKMANDLLDSAIQAAEKLPGEQGRRVRAYLALAKRVGYPRMINELWYYTPEALRAFVRSDNQPELIRLGSGFPLHGKLPGNWQGGAPSWRTYPFRGLLQSVSQAEFDNQQFPTWRLNEIDRDIGAGIATLARGGIGDATGGGGESAVSPSLVQFRKHVITLAKIQGNLYYESDRNTTDRRSFFKLW